ncbi:biotin synthase BioB [Fundidesulfovibrio agrisoli]|uniref:biotin synthase BioB n=1 Tax=Fundidesulfovibrio agrisoli TaxID=2922717 RepID=UPI001FABD89D|nr:biotin synthase BioB [Fundidesulfovibrio agrisoli]
MGIGNKTIFKDASNRVLAGTPLHGGQLDEFIAAVAEAAGEEADALLAAARRIRLETLGTAVGLCAIVNAKSGRCSENCSFCAQSGHFNTSAPVHAFLEVAQVVRAARTMRERGATRFGIVTSGLRPTGEDFQRLKQCIGEVAALGMGADTSCGVLTRSELDELREAGLSAYHHNLETARSFFPQVCTTHDYEDDVRAVRDALEAGLYVCSGGIFGLGESWTQRAELALTLRELGVPSVPVNFLTPIPGTPMGARQPMQPLEALKTVALLRFLLPGAQLRVCGGRDAVFGAERGLDPLEAGASGLMIGDYLTTKGVRVEEDVRNLRAKGWETGGD